MLSKQAIFLRVLEGIYRILYTEQSKGLQDSNYRPFTTTTHLSFSLYVSIEMPFVCNVVDLFKTIIVQTELLRSDNRLYEARENSRKHPINRRLKRVLKRT